MLSIYFVLLTALIEISSCARILVFMPIPAKSHHIPVHPILRELAAKGHQVDYYTPVPMTNSPKNINIILSNTTMDDASQEHKIDTKKMMNMGSIKRTFTVPVALHSMIKKALQNEPWFKKMLTSEEKYDVVIFEHFFGQEFVSTLCHKFQARCVAIVTITDSFWVNEFSGFPANPAYMLDSHSKLSDRLTFLERLENTYYWINTYVSRYLITYLLSQPLADEYFRYEGWESRPSLTMLGSNLDLILLKSHVSITYPTPKAPHVKEIGGVNVVPTKPLPKDLQTFMDSATEGVIYFSYGSVVNFDNVMTDGKLEALLEVFKNVKQKVLWKWNGSSITKTVPAHIKIQDWFPQQDLLSHKNLKVFFTHGGLNSIAEAINAGVPLIGTPFFGDQHRNLRFVQERQLGVQLDYDNITETSFQWALNEVLNNPKYSQAMKKQSELFRDRQLKPAEEAVYWIEYVIKHGNVLQPASAQMPLYQVLLLDVIGFLIVTTFVILYILKSILVALCGLCSRKKPAKVSKQRKVK